MALSAATARGSHLDRCAEHVGEGHGDVDVTELAAHELEARGVLAAEHVGEQQVQRLFLRAGMAVRRPARVERLGPQAIRTLSTSLGMVTAPVRQE